MKARLQTYARIPNGLERALWPEGDQVRRAYYGQEPTPPDFGMEFRQNRAGGCRPLRQPTCEDQNSVNQKQHSHKKPDWNDEVFAHVVYQKIHCKMRNATTATPAQKIGR